MTANWSTPKPPNSPGSFSKTPITSYSRPFSRTIFADGVRVREQRVGDGVADHHHVARVLLVERAR